MSEAATAVLSSDETAEAVSGDASQSEHRPGIDPEPEMPDFNLFGDDVEASVPAEAKADEPEKKEDTWSARVKKDRQQRKKEIEIKRREQELSVKEAGLTSSNELREAFLKDPEGFLANQGIDPMEFFSDWTNRISTGVNETLSNRTTSTRA